MCVDTPFTQVPKWNPNCQFQTSTTQLEQVIYSDTFTFSGVKLSPTKRKNIIMNMGESFMKHFLPLEQDSHLMFGQCRKPLNWLSICTEQTRSSRHDVGACLCLFNNAIQSKWAITLISSSIGRGYLFHLISWLTLSHHFSDEAMGADGRGKGRHFTVKADQHPRDKNKGSHALTGSSPDWV